MPIDDDLEIPPKPTRDEIRTLLIEIRDIGIVNRHYAQLIASRSALIMAAQEDMKSAVSRVEDVLTKLVELVHNHPDTVAKEAAMQAAADAEKAMADAAASLHRVAEAAESAVAAVAPAPETPSVAGAQAGFDPAAKPKPIPVP